MKGVKSICGYASQLMLVMLFAVSLDAVAAEPAVPAVAKPVAGQTQTEVAPVGAVINLNKADVQTLAQLHGVGEKKAEAIIAYRQANGGFKSVDELLQVKGIGEKTLEKNRARLAVN